MAKIAYIVSAFPTVTETFILYDLLAMEKLGIQVELYPLRRFRPKVIHPEASEWTRRARYLPYLSFAVLGAHWRFIREDARGYVRVLAEILEGTWGSANYFLGALAIFPKAVKFAEEMKAAGVSHVHAQFANHPALAALVVHRLTGIPFSFTARGTDVQVDRRMLKEKLEAAQFAIAVSSCNKEIMTAECGTRMARKIQVVHGGVDVDRLAPAQASRSSETFRILCVARFEEVKGHAYLVEACRRLKCQGVRLECRLVGDGPLFPAIAKQVASADLGDEVMLLGALPYPEVIRELRQADLVVLPTAPTASGKREGIPNVLKEAMACGVPVVSSAVGGIPELVEDGLTGILVPPRNLDALASAIARLSQDSDLRARMGRAGREKVVRDFNLEASTLRRAQLFLHGAEIEERIQAAQEHPAAGAIVTGFIA